MASGSCSPKVWNAFDCLKLSYYDNDFVTTESGALETRRLKNERNGQHFMTGSSLRLAPVIMFFSKWLFHGCLQEGVNTHLGFEVDIISGGAFFGVEGLLQTSFWLPHNRGL